MRTKPTLQIDDDSLPNVFVCGDLAGHGEKNPNARSAMRKAMIAADNVVLATQGKELKHTYAPFWADAVIKLTLGMVSGCRAHFPFSSFRPSFTANLVPRIAL